MLCASREYVGIDHRIWFRRVNQTERVSFAQCEYLVKAGAPTEKFSGGGGAQSLETNNYIIKFLFKYSILLVFFSQVEFTNTLVRKLYDMVSSIKSDGMDYF